MSKTYPITLRHFKINTTQAPNRIKSLRMFYDDAPRTAVHAYPEEMLKSVMRKGIPGMPFEYCKTTIHNTTTIWKTRALYPESDPVPEDLSLLLVSEELEIHTNNIRWVKIALFNNKTKTYYLRSISNTQEHPGYKTLAPSQDPEWFIDDATLSADHSFWRLLMSIVLNTHP